MEPSKITRSYKLHKKYILYEKREHNYFWQLQQIYTKYGNMVKRAHTHIYIPFNFFYLLTTLIRPQLSHRAAPIMPCSPDLLHRSARLCSKVGWGWSSPNLCYINFFFKILIYLYEFENLAQSSSAWTVLFKIKTAWSIRA